MPLWLSCILLCGFDIIQDTSNNIRNLYKMRGDLGEDTLIPPHPSKFTIASSVSLLRNRIIDPGINNSGPCRTTCCLLASYSSVPN